jgi:hypothetical protein
VRMTTLLKKLLGIQHLLVTGLALEDGALVIEVRPSWRAPRCSGCKKRRGRYDTLPARRWRTSILAACGCTRPVWAAAGVLPRLRGGRRRRAVVR